MVKNAEEQNEAWNKNQNEMQLLNNELKQLKSRYETNQMIKELFDYVDVDNEEDYYTHHHHFETYQNDLNRFIDLNQYLENQNYTYEMSSQLSEKTTAQLEEEDHRLAKQVDDYNDQF